MQRKLLVIPLLLLLSLTACGPKQGGVEVPTINRVAIAAKDFSTSVLEFQSMEIAMYNAGRVSAASHIDIQEVLKETSVWGWALNDSIRIADESSLRRALQEALTASERLLERTRAVRDADTRQKLIVAVLGARAFLATIYAIYGGVENENPVTTRNFVTPYTQSLPLAA